MNIAIQQPLPTAMTEFLTTLAERAEQFGETFGVVFKKTEVSKGLGKDLKTITHYLKKLEDAKMIKMATKRGANGGTIVLFNEELIHFEQTDVPYFTDTKSIQELEEHFFPKSQRPEPKRKYRSKSEILAEKAFKGRVRAEQDRLNAILAESDFPTLAFFEETENPELYMKAYLLSRMYNTYAVIFPEARKNASEAAKDLEAYNRASYQADHYKDYDCLQKEFIGTSAFTCFIKLAELLEQLRATPLAYLTSQFKHMEFLDAHTARASLPFVNTLYGEKAQEIYFRDKNHYQGINRRGHKIVEKDRFMPIRGIEYPIVQLLDTMYADPTKETHAFDDVLSTIDPFDMMVSAPYKEQALYAYHNTIIKHINASDLIEEEKDVLTTYMKQQTTTFLGRRGLVPHQYLLTHVGSLLQTRKDLSDLTEGNRREYYAKIGNTSELREFTIPEQSGFVKRGYLIDFSVHGSKTFYSTLKTLQSLRKVAMDTELFMRAWDNFGKSNIPIKKNGMLDLEQVYSKFLSEEQLQQDKENFDFSSMNELIPVDGTTKLWYDVVERYVGASQRDGRWIEA